MQLYVRLLHGIHTVNQTGIKQNQKKKPGDCIMPSPGFLQIIFQLLLFGRKNNNLVGYHFGDVVFCSFVVFPTAVR